eukprot:8088048-Pyramimonas_sp.AAC.1
MLAGSCEPRLCDQGVGHGASEADEHVSDHLRCPGPSACAREFEMLDRTELLYMCVLIKCRIAVAVLRVPGSTVG